MSHIVEGLLTHIVVTDFIFDLLEIELHIDILVIDLELPPADPLFDWLRPTSQKVYRFAFFLLGLDF